MVAFERNTCPPFGGRHHRKEQLVKPDLSRPIGDFTEYRVLLIEERERLAAFLSLISQWQNTASNRLNTICQLLRHVEKIDEARELLRFHVLPELPKLPELPGPGEPESDQPEETTF
jgi:hypothetical protein